MKILVCISHVPDTTAKISFVNDNKDYNKEGQQFIIGPNEELALTSAIDIKDAKGGSITAITVGQAEVEPTLRKALAVGADEAIRVDAKPEDAYFVAKQLAEVAKDFDLIMAGIEASDYNGSGVGGMLAEMLGINSVSAVSGIDIENGELKIHRDIDGGSQVLSVPTPVLTIVQKGIAIDPRIPAMRGIMMARKKPLNVVPAVDAAPRTEFINYELPAPKAACKMVDEDNAKELITLLHEEAKAF